MRFVGVIRRFDETFRHFEVATRERPATPQMKTPATEAGVRLAKHVARRAGRPYFVRRSVPRLPAICWKIVFSESLVGA